MEESQKQAETLLWLRITIVLCLYVAAISVLDSFIQLFSYWTFLSKEMDPNRHPEWIEQFKRIQNSPYSFLALNLYNIVLWNGVIICSIWVLRYYSWSRRVLTALLGFDMILTAVHIVWEYFSGTLEITYPGWFIVLNALQVSVIVALSHPRVVDLTEQLSLKRKQSVRQFDKSDLC